jgi:predicted outer membrane repeat protein
LATNAPSGSVITETRFSGNRAAGNGGGIQGAAVIERSTLDGNDAGHFGGGWGAAAGAIRNSTASGNLAGHYPMYPTPPGEGGGGIQADAALEVTHATFTHNRAAEEAGSAIRGPGVISMTNTAVLGNTGYDCNALVHSGGGNIAINMSCLTSLGRTPRNPDDLNISGLRPSPSTDTVLDPVLRNNGGRTPTHALPPGSVAINLAASGLAIDQRGIARSQLGCFDSGAYEVTGP